MATAVIGRDEELGSIEVFLARSRRPAALVLSGEPGIGKTVLWEAGVQGAEERFARVLLHRSVQAESLALLAGLSDLSHRSSTTSRLRLPASPACARGCAPAGGARGRSPGPRAIGVALLDVLGRSPSGARPRRARRAPVARPGVRRRAPGRAPRLADERRLSRPCGRRRTRPPGGARASVRGGAQRDGSCSARSGSARCTICSGDRLALGLTQFRSFPDPGGFRGNPFFALELGRELGGRRRGLPPDECCGSRRACTSSSTAGSPGFRQRHATPSSVRRRTCQPDRRDGGRGRARRTGRRVLDALEAAVREGVVEVRELPAALLAPTPGLAFCWQDAPVLKRREMHRALARASSLTSRSGHGTWLSGADGPDAAVASALEAAAELAAARGAPAAGAELAELAAELTPDAPPWREQRRLRAARFHRLAGDRERADALLERLLRRGSVRRGAVGRPLRAGADTAGRPRDG